MGRLKTLEEVSSVWIYEPDTGVLRWKIDRPRAPAGGVAGGKPKERCSYVDVTYDGHGYKAHRVGWLLATGAWPIHEIDHINGDRHDNRLCNLRDVPHKINQLNQKHHRLGTLKADWRRKLVSDTLDQNSDIRGKNSDIRL